MLTVSSLSAGYGSAALLGPLSLRVEPGQIHAVIGPNGAGKSTLLHTISGLLAARSGEVLVGETEIGQLPEVERARLIAVVPQARSLPGAYSVYQTVLMGRTPYLGWFGHPQAADHDQVHWALTKTSCLDIRHRPIGTLSGGEQQRVLLARALAQATPVLLLDEPTTHLDLHHQHRLLQLVRQLAREKSLAVLMVLHDLNQVGLIADQVSLLCDGTLRASGPPAAVLTAAHLQEAYRVPIHLVAHPQTGKPVVLPVAGTWEDL